MKNMSKKLYLDMLEIGQSTISQYLLQSKWNMNGTINNHLLCMMRIKTQDIKMPPYKRKHTVEEFWMKGE